jgi:hypothetical protein
MNASRHPVTVSAGAVALLAPGLLLIAGCGNRNEPANVSGQASPPAADASAPTAGSAAPTSGTARDAPADTTGPTATGDSGASVGGGAG